ncbi:hypothetical protein ACFQ1M_05075 [Sungkyunkwania multivorans]|uniref:Secreted repeat protein with Y-X4-D motif n=1 Tax=Sungkyunkwania multivorans TaxID=1173618 RepID=A0ABW3CV13_9FLAO
MRNILTLSMSFVLLLSSCSSDDYGQDGNNNSPPANNAVRLSSDANFGNVLTNAEGFTLYFLSADSKGTSNCLGNCIDMWPPFYAEDLTLDSGLDTNNFATITREDGSKQNTYKGWPLYRFANDPAPGNITGDGFGDVWFVAKPDYTIMMAKAQLVGRSLDGVETNLTSDLTPGDGETAYITDAAGNTLYSFSDDYKETNTFTNADFSNNGVWPIFEEALENVPSILDPADFLMIDVFGRQQLTYKGWPLYYFGQDAQRGDNYGVGFPTAGVWPVLNKESAAAPPVETDVTAIFNVTNQGASAYLFNGGDFSNTSNPSITLERGKTYEFNIDAPGHPFLIKSDQSTGTGNQYNNGVSNNGASDGTITFTVPQDAPNTLFYICEFHGSMTGTFNIVD